MKKSILFVTTALLLVASMVISFAACKKTPKNDETTTEVTTQSSTEATTAGDGTTLPGTATTIENVTELSADEIAKDAPVAKNGTAGSLDEKALDKMDDYKPKASSGSGKHLKDNYKDLFNSKKLLMKIKVESKEEDLNGSSMLIAFNDKDTYCQYDMMGISLAMLNVKGKTYVLCPANKTYTLLPADSTQDMSDITGSLGEIVNDDDSTFVKTETVTLNGKKMTAETYKSGDTLQKYYFDGTQLVRIEVLDASGNVDMAFNVEKLTSDFDNSIFSIPRGYVPLTNTVFFTTLASKYSNIFN